MDSVLQLEDNNGVLNHKEALVANHKEDMVVNHKVVLVVNHKVDMVLLEPKLEDSGELKEELNQEPKLVANGVPSQVLRPVVNGEPKEELNQEPKLVANGEPSQVLRPVVNGEPKEELNQDPKLVANGVLSNQAHHKVDNMELEHRAVPKANGEPDNLSPPNMGFLLRNLKIASN